MFFGCDGSIIRSLIGGVDVRNRDHVETFVELIRRASTELPPDVVRAFERVDEPESEGSLAERALGTILNNVELAEERSAPICQDTGTPVVWIHHPGGRQHARCSTQRSRRRCDEATETHVSCDPTRWTP